MNHNAGEVLLRVEHIDKSFGSTHALKDISFDILPGEICGLIGENGSGKSTVSSIISGLLKADKGQMQFLGKPYAPQTVIEANKLGVCMIVQEQSTVDTVTVAANIFLGEEDTFTRFGLVDNRRMNQEAQKALDAIGATHIRPGELTKHLSFEDRKMVELARAFYRKPKLIIVDETTTALSKTGRDVLYRLIERHRDEGGSVIFISHELKEVMDKCDRITVLRDGELTAVLPREEFTEHTIRNLMVGREIDDTYYRTDRERHYGEEVVLRAENLRSDTVKGVSLALHRGEILGVGGLTDCGMHELGKLLFGALKPDGGEVLFKEKTRVTDPTMAIRAHIGYMSKNRDIEALMTNATISDNICLTAFPLLEKFRFISNRREKRFANQWADEMNVKRSSISDNIRSLSGGNKQKVIFAKWLSNGTEVFIMDCPTRGIDIGVKAAIYQIMERLKAENKSILMISEELPELLGMCDRVLILKDGRVNGEFLRDSEAFSEQDLIRAMI